MAGNAIAAEKQRLCFLSCIMCMGGAENVGDVHPKPYIWSLKNMAGRKTDMSYFAQTATKDSTEIAGCARTRPILFSGNMVLAVLRGEKSQNRRVITRRNSLSSIGWDRLDFTKPAYIDDSYNPPCAMVKIAGPEGTSHRVFSRYEVGDRLWVRETVATDGPWNIPECCTLWYPADGGERPTGYQTRSSIHMPRWASRITLEITEVRVERVQEISEDDARAEGCVLAEGYEALATTMFRDPYRAVFDDIWDSINAKRGYGWDTNPLVWALTFKLLELANKEKP